MCDIERSELDKKSYRIIHLENGVRAILISDLKPGETVPEEPEEEEEDLSPNDEAGEDASEDEEAMEMESGDANDKHPQKKVQMSAAAICINAGSLHEDNEVQGLAHYLEHMVFMGSEKYPSENDFDAFVSQRGGSYNAWTDCEMTLFYFDVHRRFFRSSLDRFANFFVSPLLSASSMDREVTAVDSEFKMSLSQDSWRVEHFTKTLADLDHPYSFFTIGNVESLKTTPQARGIDVYKNLQERRKRMYSAQYITVAVQSKESLDDLEKLVRDIFVHVQNNGIERPMVPKNNPFRNDRFMGKLYKIVPIKDIRKLIITWVLPPYRHKYLSRPHAIFGFLLGHESKGSILSYLRKKNLAVGLTAGCYGSGFELNECATMIRLEAMLTEEGLERVDEVIEAVFSYCAVLRKHGLPDDVFGDMRQLAANSFRFQEEQEPIDLVCLLAENLQKYKEEHVISGGYVYHDYNKQLYAEALSHLVPHEANFMLLSMKFEHKDNKVEKWYSISYSEEAIPKEKLQKWMDIQPDESVFYLPKRNEFIAQDFKLIDHQAPYAKHPVKLDLPDSCKDHGVLWYMQDTKFSMPKAACNFFLCTPTYINQPRHYVVAKVMIEIINQELADVTYDAEEADLRYNLTACILGIDLQVEGFNDKLFKLFTTVVDALSDFKPDAAKFAACKEKVRQELVNFAYQPRKLYSDIQNFALRNKATLVSELLDLVRSVELKDVVELAKTSWNPGHLLAYIHGNLTPAEAIEYFTYCKKQLDFEAWPKPERLLCAEVPIGETKCRVRNLNPCDVNTVLVDYYQLGPADLRLSVRSQLLNEILNEPCFNFLRTKETLGYAVWFRRFCTAGVEALSVHVESQADKFPLEHCHAKMLEFIEREAKEKLDGLSQKDFDIYVSSLIKSKMVEDVNMGQLVRRNWDEITNDNLLFDRLEREVRLLGSISKQEVLDLFHSSFLQDSKRKLVFQVNADEKPLLTGGEEKIYHLDITVEPVDEKWVKSLDDLRKNAKYHPYIRVV